MIRKGYESHLIKDTVTARGANVPTRLVVQAIKSTSANKGVVDITTTVDVDSVVLMLIDNNIVVTIKTDRINRDVTNECIVKYPLSKQEFLCNGRPSSHVSSTMVLEMLQYILGIAIDNCNSWTTTQ